jgi:hypothetical protein
MSEWRPIETAPMDATDFLLWDGRLLTVGWALNQPVWHSHVGRFTPTHWMPLPEPPK